jgi:hypothetical protein
MKSVTFQEEGNLSVVVCELTPRSQLSREDRDNAWFSESDYIAMKDYGRLIAKELRRSGRARLLEGSLQDINDKHNVEDVDIVQQMLIQWSRLGGSCRGLERWIHVAEGKKRKREQRCSIEAVLEAQEKERLSVGCTSFKRLRDVSGATHRKGSGLLLRKWVSQMLRPTFWNWNKRRGLFTSWNRSSSSDSMLYRRMPTKLVINPAVGWHKEDSSLTFPTSGR